jgi:hypothetical protein
VINPSNNNGTLFHQNYIVVFIGCAIDCGKLSFLIKPSAVTRLLFLGCGMTDYARSLAEDEVLPLPLVSDFCLRLLLQDLDRNVSSKIIDEKRRRSSRSIARYFKLIAQGT